MEFQKKISYTWIDEIGCNERNILHIDKNLIHKGCHGLHGEKSFLDESKYWLYWW